MQPTGGESWGRIRRGGGVFQEGAVRGAAVTALGTEPLPSPPAWLEFTFTVIVAGRGGPPRLACPNQFGEEEISALRRVAC